MKQVYVVTEIDENHIFVSQEKHIEGHGTKKHGKLEVINPRRFKIQVGTRVYIGLSKSNEAIKGIICLFTPILSCAAALFCSPFLAKIFCAQQTQTAEPSETFKFLCMVAAFVVTAAIIIKFSRNTETIVKLHIKSIAKK